MQASTIDRRNAVCSTDSKQKTKKKTKTEKKKKEKKRKKKYNLKS